MVIRLFTMPSSFLKYFLLYGNAKNKKKFKFEIAQISQNKANFSSFTQGGKGSSEGKKVQQILTSKYVMGILNWFKIVKNKKIHEAILEIAVNTHSPFCPKLVDYSACVPPALQNGFVNSFDFDNFELHKHSYTQFWSQTLLDFFSLWVILATLGGVHLNHMPWWVY